MIPRINPILNDKITAINWKINQDKDARENLKDIISIIKEKIENIQGGKLKVEHHIKEKKELLKTLKETGQNLLSIAVLEKEITKRWTKELSKKLKTKTTPEILREFLKLKEKENNIRMESAEFDEAWVEIEAKYFLKMSLYQMELHKLINK